jgi:hypothetical protein
MTVSNCRTRVALGHASTSAVTPQLHQPALRYSKPTATRPRRRQHWSTSSSRRGTCCPQLRRLVPPAFLRLRLPKTDFDLPSLPRLADYRCLLRPPVLTVAHRCRPALVHKAEHLHYPMRRWAAAQIGPPSSRS